MISTIKKNFVRRLFKLPRNRVNKDQVKDFLGSPEKAFTVTALVFGIMAVIVMPIFMIPDENVHFYRAYHIGEGKLVGQKVDGKIGTYGPLLPPTTIREDGSSIVVPVNQYFKKIKAPEIFTNFPTTSIASPVMYIPQAIGIDMGRIVNGSLGSMVLVGRLMNLAAYILLVVLAIRIAKMGKWVYVVVGLFPVAIQQAGSLSADVMTIGLAFVAIAFIQSMLVQRSRIGRRQIVAIILLGMCLSLTKQNSILLLLPLIFLPKRLFAHGKQKYGLLASVFGASLLSLGLWYGFVHASYDGLSPIVDTGSQNVNPSAQLRHIFEQPLSFLEVL